MITSGLFQKTTRPAPAELWISASRPGYTDLAEFRVRWSSLLLTGLQAIKRFWYWPQDSLESPLISLLCFSLTTKIKGGRLES